MEGPEFLFRLTILSSFTFSAHPSVFLLRLPQPRTPRCQAAVRASTAWPPRVTAARWEVTAAPCLEEEEEEGGGIASFPTETQSSLGY